LAGLEAALGSHRSYALLFELLSNRNYEMFLEALERVSDNVDGYQNEGVAGYFETASYGVWIIQTYASTTLGTMEGTNAKVYAARMKVWGCAWSKRGAIAMMRIRATIASGGQLIAPGYDPYLTEKERQRIEKYRKRYFHVPKRSGLGYEPPQASVVLTTRMPGGIYGLINYS